MHVVSVAAGLALLLVGVAVVLVVHEVGHAFAAFVVGARNLSIRWGTASRALGAHVVADLPDTRVARVAFFAAGPVASALFGAACVVAGEGVVRPLVSVLGFLSVVFALVCAFGSDGRGVVHAMVSSRRNDADGVER